MSEQNDQVQAKQEVLDKTIKDIERQFGKGSIMRLGENKHMRVEVIPSGCISLDIAMGVGGFPRGRVIEVFGPESSGKTTVTLHAIAQAQKLGGMAAFIDAEHALDPFYARRLGVDINNLLVAQPDSGEQALEITEALVRSGAVDIIVIDSVAALVPRSELDGSMGDTHVGLQARLMSQAMRKLTANISKSKTTVIFINQIREKVGNPYGNPETTTGGRALKFYSSVRVEVRKGEPIKQGVELIGSRTRVKIVKNKVAPPFKSTEVDIMYGTGISREGDVLDMGVLYGLVEKSGSWYSYKGERMGQGRENAKEFLHQNEDTYAELENQIKAKVLKNFELESEETPLGEDAEA